MKKIGILTYHKAENYGAILQAYALKSFLESTTKDLQVEIINYRTSKIEAKYRIFHYNRDQPIKSNIYRFVNNVIFYPRYLKMNKFRNKYLNLSKKYDFQNKIEIQEDFYKVIVGSDQVWNPEINNNDLTFYLSFIDSNKKYSYAASFGVSKIENINTEIQNALNEYQKISIREADGLKILQSIGYDMKNVEIDLDPVFLLKDKWKNLNGKITAKKKYILIYQISKQEKLLEFAKLKAKKENMKIIYIPHSVKDIFKFRNSKIAIDPFEFVNLFRNAEYIITNSFHGFSFSLIFKKNVSLEIMKSNPTSSRYFELIKKFNLAYINEDNEFNNIYTFTKNIQDDIMSNETRKSKNYLERIVYENGN